MPKAEPQVFERPLPLIPDARFKHGLKPLTQQERLAETYTKIGFDTETLPYRYIGLPVKNLEYSDLYSVQLCNRQVADFHFANFKAGVNWLWSHFPERAMVFAFNLPFDLGAMLGKDYELFLKKSIVDFTTPEGQTLKLSGFIVDGIMSFADFKFFVEGVPDDDGEAERLTIKHIRFMDVANFFGKRPLSTIAKEQFPDDADLWKMEKPTYLGLRLPNKDEIEYFQAYAVQDAKVSLALGLKILQSQDVYAIRPCMTPASMSIAVFRKMFLKYPIMLPSQDCINDIWQTYFGGRFEAFGRGSFGEDGKPVQIFDFNSLYPHSACFPMPLQHNCFSDISLNEVENNPLITGFCSCDFRFPSGTTYPCLPQFTHKMYFPLRGHSNCTLYELRYALEMGAEVKNLKTWAFYPTQAEIDHPIKEFVHHFYAKKVDFDRIKAEQDGTLTPKQEDERYYNKLMLNSFYGKFAEKNKQWQSTTLKAGKFFQPAIASLITGKARETLARSIVKYKSLYSDTDSIATLSKADKKDLGNELGKLKVEISGKLVIIRPKIYRAFDGKKEKLASHTFRDPNVMRQIFEHPEKFFDGFFYQKERLLKIKEAIKRGLIARATISQNFKVQFQADNKRIYHKNLKGLYEIMTDCTLSDPPKTAPMERQKYV